MCSLMSGWFANIVEPHSRCTALDRYDLRRLDWNTVYCTHGTLQEASIMRNSQGSVHVFLATYLLLQYRNARASLARTQNTLAITYWLMLSLSLTHTHTRPFTHTQRLTHAQGPPWDHTASISRSLSSPPIDYCCILWLDWTTPDNISHRLYSFPAHLHTLPRSPTHSLLPLPHQHPSRVCLSLAFISPAYWTPPLASECDALMVRPLFDINPYLPPLHISMLTNDLQCLPFLAHNRTYSLCALHWSVHGAPWYLKYAGGTWSVMYLPKKQSLKCVNLSLHLSVIQTRWKRGRERNV